MQSAQKIRIASADHLARLSKLISNLPVDGSIEVVIRPFKRDCTAEQRALMWVRIAEIADQAWISGKQFSSAAWHIELKKMFLPEGFTEGITKDKYEKWVESPSGERELVGSTEMLTAKGKAEYMTQIEAFGAGELGVQFSADERGRR